MGFNEYSTFLGFLYREQVPMHGPSNTAVAVHCDGDADFVFKPGICQRKQLNQALNERIAAQRKRGQEVRTTRIEIKQISP